MNILYLTTHLNVGGISSYVLTLAGGLRKRGHNVYIASSGGELLANFSREGIIFIPIPIKTKCEISPKILLSLFKLLKFVKEKDIQIIHSHTRVTQVLGCLLQRYSHRTHVSTCHGFFKKRFFRRIFASWGDKVIAISESVKEHLIKDFKVSEENVRLIYSGIDLEKFRTQDSRLKTQTKRELGLKEGPVIGIIARLSDIKGHIYLIEAMKSVLAKIPGAQLLIVGEGKMKKELINLSKTLGIEKNVFFIPNTENTALMLSVIDIFVMPSLKEGLGLGLMEAMAAGLAVIGSDVGGIRNLIRDGYTGSLVKPADARELSSAIIGLLTDKKKAEYLGHNARIFIQHNFPQEKMVLETQKLYSECLNPRF